MNTTSKMMVSGILVILVVAVGSYSIIQVNAQSGAQKEEEDQRQLQIQDCNQLKDKMANDAQAAEQYKSKDCAGLLAGTS
jgi:hypothetical protein